MTSRAPARRSQCPHIGEGDCIPIGVREEGVVIGRPREQDTPAEMPRRTRRSLDRRQVRFEATSERRPRSDPKVAPQAVVDHRRGAESAWEGSEDRAVWTQGGSKVVQAQRRVARGCRAGGNRSAGLPPPRALHFNAPPVGPMNSRRSRLDDVAGSKSGTDQPGEGLPPSIFAGTGPRAPGVKAEAGVLATVADVSSALTPGRTGPNSKATAGKAVWSSERTGGRSRIREGRMTAAPRNQGGSGPP
jgi:hypothetical protein